MSKNVIEKACVCVEVDTDTVIGLIARAEKLESELSSVINQLSMAISVKIAPTEQGENT